MSEENKKKNKKKSPEIEIEAITNELNEAKDKILRLQADMVNMRKRQNEEILRIRQYEGEEIITNLLPTVDNFERAIKEDDNNLEDELSIFLSGFKMIYGNMYSYLKSIGLEEIEAINKPFDPTKMEAVVVDSDKNFESNIVLEVFQKGYKYKDKVIRPAMVKVNK